MRKRSAAAQGDNPYKWASAWCCRASEYIQNPRRRKKIRQELYAHMEEHIEDLLDAGFDVEEAERRAVQSMGSAVETGLLFAQIYPPWPPWLIRCSVLFLLFCLFTAICFARMDIQDFGSKGDRTIYDAVYGEAQAISTSVTELTKGDKLTAAGYTLSVERGFTHHSRNRLIIELCCMPEHSAYFPSQLFITCTDQSGVPLECRLVSSSIGDLLEVYLYEIDLSSAQHDILQLHHTFGSVRQTLTIER